MMSVTALQMFEDGVGSRRLAFGCELIDKCTRGGLPLQGINEIVGEAGAGKTQFALTLSLQCHLIEAEGGLSGATAYICCGEGLFPVRRLEQLSHCFQNKSGISYTEFMDSVHIEQCHNADDVLHTLVCLRWITSGAILFTSYTLMSFLHNFFMKLNWSFRTKKFLYVQLQKIPNMCTTKGIRLIVIDRWRRISHDASFLVILSDLNEAAANLVVYTIFFSCLYDLPAQIGQKIYTQANLTQLFFSFSFLV